jgi:hypothetical protein
MKSMSMLSLFAVIYSCISMNAYAQGLWSCGGNLPGNLSAVLTVDCPSTDCNVGISSLSFDSKSISSVSTTGTADAVESSTANVEFAINPALNQMGIASISFKPGNGPMVRWVYLIDKSGAEFKAACM